MTAPKRGSGLATRAAVPSLVGLFVPAYPLRHVLLPFVVAAALACPIRPAIAWAQRRLRLPRLLALLIAYAVAVGGGSRMRWPARSRGSARRRPRH